MSDRTFDNVQLNVKWKLNGDDTKPPIYPTSGQDANGYVNENLSDRLGIIGRHLTDAIYVDDFLTINGIADGIENVVHYGVKIAKNDSNPYTRVTYMYDAIGFTPARMVYNTTDPEQSYFSYGSWANAFFMQNNYPCMCRYDGTEDYELSHSDHTKKIDGTDSDVGNLDYEGNAQSCFNCKIWLYHHTDADYEYYEISNVQLTENFHLNAYVRADGTIADKVYFPMYKGSTDGTRLRSMSSSDTNDIYPQNKTTSTQEIALCDANGEKWQIGDWAHRELLNALLILISKNDDSQTAFGQGCTSGGADNASINYGFPKNGSLNTKGQFFGYTATTKAVKVFYIENWWGTRWDRCLGLFNDKGEYKVKWTPPYSDTSTTGCISTGITVPATGWQKETSNTYGRLPISVGGSASTYTCDYFWSNNGQLNLALCGGSAWNGSSCGAWCVNLHFAPSSASWHVGASPYLK